MLQFKLVTITSQGSVTTEWQDDFYTKGYLKRMERYDEENIKYTLYIFNKETGTLIHRYMN